MGTGVAVELGTRYLFKSIVLEAPFTSISDIAQKKYKIYPVKFFVLDKFDKNKKIIKVFSPLLIISGMKDEVIRTVIVLSYLQKRMIRKIVFLLAKQCIIIYMISILIRK